MRSRQILSILLKKYDINFHFEESDQTFNAIMFDKQNRGRLKIAKDTTLPKLLKQCRKFYYEQSKIPTNDSKSSTM